MILDDLKPLQTVIFYFHKDDREAENALGYLIESERWHNLPGGYKARFDRGVFPATQDHLHFYQRKKELYSLNRDGTAHDHSHGKRLHNTVMKWMEDQYPNFTIPPRGLIESMFDEAASAKVIGEAVQVLARKPVNPEVLLAPDTMTAALNLATLDGSN